MIGMKPQTRCRIEESGLHKGDENRSRVSGSRTGLHKGDENRSIISGSKNRSS
ncbi:hypothetical protein [Bacillus dakarensis]|uniref:hypothetical protein n=1 Tax=Robertmurraya dakarensis TaxID=1926278 RepID=UPI0012B6961B|nr:hypothetical protein [Bacillus dakarensis]